MSAPIRYALPQRPATVAVIGIAAYYFGRENPSFANVFGGTANLDKWFYIIAKVHVAEAAAMFVYTLYRGADLVTSIKYTLTQLVVGFPTFFQFKKLNK
ncbi:uncharacterized protein SPSC_05505 [Sporisorium scitamineum]|uniref:Uncharacterized protein n=1 Tax=Sporisorium scitamineum TaxID=49012 RepID=A0A0F7RVR5_9BASI|nr:hypothetical protein [Sporisorium scitamineum]CDU25612.1 uncharacterized protein SPSC_05505 [Sporisorium scitamineum]